MESALIKKFAIAAVLLFLVISGYYTCLSSDKPKSMCESRGGCWNTQANECEFEDMTKCK